MSGAQLRRLRLELDLTQAQLAEKLDMERKVIIRQEKRKRVEAWLAICVSCLAKHQGRDKG